MIRVVVADDHPAPRAGIVLAIQRDPDIEIIGEASTGPEVWDRLANERFDVLLLDLTMPDFDPYREVPEMRKRYPDVQILIVTADDTEESVSSFADAKVAGYLLKEEDADRYIEAIHDVAEGRAFFSKRILSAALNGVTAPTPLTKRELQVLERLAEGGTSAQIAHVLKITKRTVDFHASNIMQKLDVEGRAAATAKATQMGLLPRRRTP